MKHRAIKRSIFITLLTLIFIINFFVPYVVTNGVSKTVKINYIDVGQADSILIQSNGSNMLIDAGNRNDDVTVINYLVKHGVKKLDYVIGTHPHEDHIGGMSAVLNKFKANKIIMPKVTSNTKVFKELLLTIKSKGLKITTPIPGTSFKVGGATCTILAPNSSNYKDINNNSVVIRMVYGKTSFMFDGDAEDISENEILHKGYNIRSDVLKLGHHGSNSSTMPTFLNKVKPKYAIISCGKNNDYGHPSKETINKLVSRNIKFYRTDTNGSIVCTTDGKNISFITTGSSKPNNTITPNSSGVSTSAVVPKVNSTKKNISNKVFTVYVSKTGKKYHLANCKTFKSKKIPISLSEAKSKGYEPCKVCNPPR